MAAADGFIEVQGALVSLLIDDSVRACLLIVGSTPYAFDWAYDDCGGNELSDWPDGPWQPDCAW